MVELPRSPEAQREYMRNYMREKRAAARGDGAKTAASAAAPAASKKATSTKAPAARSSRRHRDAVARMFRVTGLLHVPEEAPLVQLVKDLAFDLDAGGGNEVYAKYLAALKDVRRVLAFNARPQTSSDVVPKSSPSPVEDDEGDREESTRVSSLANFKSKRGIS